MRESPTRGVPPPLRFLALVVGGWICVRAAILAPALWTLPRGPDVAPPPRSITVASLAPPVKATAAAAAPSAAARPGGTVSGSPIRETPDKRPESAFAAFVSSPHALARRLDPSDQPRVPPPAIVPPGEPELLSSPKPMAAADRWSGAAWLLLRGDRGGAALVPGGTLGGSQAGARILYRIGGGISLSGRAYAPLRRRDAAEVAAGLDWRPAAAIPLNLVAERRQAIGREGRSAFSITAYGGASRRLPGGLRLDAYGQAGIVGLRSRDAFVDGSARVSGRIGPVEVGAGAWGAAQPGAARLDAGPSLAYRPPVTHADLRLRADWRLRVAGRAAPGSGPALTLAIDF